MQIGGSLHELSKILITRKNKKNNNKKLIYVLVMYTTVFCLFVFMFNGGGRVVRTCRVSNVTWRQTDIGLQLGKACYP